MQSRTIIRLPVKHIKFFAVAQNDKASYPNKKGSIGAFFVGYIKLKSTIF